MGMKKRIVEVRDVIPRCDRALTLLPQETIRKYSQELDISILGDPANMLEMPAIVSIAPLKARWAHLDRGTDNTASDYWAIFALHVQAIKGNAQVDMEWTGEGDFRALTDKVHEQIPEDVIRDVAQMIIQLANGEGTHVPFDVLVGLSATISARRMTARPAQRRVTIAEPAPTSTADATDKNSDTSTTHPTED